MPLHSELKLSMTTVEIREVPASHFKTGEWWVRVPKWLCGKPTILTSDPERLRRELEAADAARKEGV